MRARTFVLTMLAALTLASSAWADGAWVLWNDVTFISRGSGPSHTTALISAAPTYRECEQDRGATAKGLVRITDSDRGPKIDRVTVREDENIITKTMHLKDGGTAILMYRLSCLPDTIDPRGPRTK